MKLNLAALVNHYKAKGYSLEKIAKGAGLKNPQTLNNLMNPKRSPTITNVVSAFVNLGRAADTMFQASEEFRSSLVTSPPRPLPLQNPLESIDSSDSGPTRSRDRFGKVKGRKTAVRQVGNARYEQVASDLHEAA